MSEICLNFLQEQECIPVGCVLSTAVAVSCIWGGRGAVGVLKKMQKNAQKNAQQMKKNFKKQKKMQKKEKKRKIGGVTRRGCLLWGSAALGVSAWGVCTLGGDGIPACTEADTPPCGQIDACKTSLRTVTSKTELTESAYQQLWP